jgi:hypothetical protein
LYSAIDALSSVAPPEDIALAEQIATALHRLEWASFNRDAKGEAELRTLLDGHALSWNSSGAAALEAAPIEHTTASSSAFVQKRQSIQRARTQQSRSKRALPSCQLRKAAASVPAAAAVVAHQGQRAAPRSSVGSPSYCGQLARRLKLTRRKRKVLVKRRGSGFSTSQPNSPADDPHGVAAASCEKADIAPTVQFVFEPSSAQQSDIPDANRAVSEADRYRNRKRAGKFDCEAGACCPSTGSFRPRHTAPRSTLLRGGSRAAHFSDFAAPSGTCRFACLHGDGGGHP